MPKNLGFDTKTMSLERFRIFKFRPKKLIWAIFRRVTSLRHRVYGRLGWFLLIFGIIWSPGNLRLALVRPLKKKIFAGRTAKTSSTASWVLVHGVETLFWPHCIRRFQNNVLHWFRITILSSQVKYGGVRNTNISGKCAALIWDHDFVEPNKMWRGMEN